MGADVVYVWLKGGMALALTMNESSRVHLDNGSLVINDVMEDDDDEYVCIVLNIDTAENITSEVAYLTVLCEHPVCMFVCLFVVNVCDLSGVTVYC